MTQKITMFKGLEAQPRFPREDLSDTNAEILELMLSNRELARLGHVEGEQIIEAFRRIHPAVVGGAQRIYDDPSRVEAIDHGVASFETMSLLLSALIDPDMTLVHHNSAGLLAYSGVHTVEKYVEAAYNSFRSDLPRTAEVIDNSSRRFYGHNSTYSQLGAAMMRQVELDSTN